MTGIAWGGQVPEGVSPLLNDASTSSAVGTTPLTITEALDLAEKNSPILKAAAASVSRAEASIQSARAYTNPTTEFLGGHQAARPIATPGVPGAMLHYSVGQTIENPTARRTRISASTNDYRGSRYEYAALRLSVKANVQRAFYDVIRRKQQLAYAHDNLSLVEDLRRRVQKEVEVGEKGKLELTRAEAELARARVAVRSADVQLAHARVYLRALLGSTANEVYDPQGSLGDSVSIPPLPDIRQQVLAMHPALAQADALIDRAQAQVQNERARRIPEPTVYGQYERQPDVSFYQFGVNVPLPLWDRRKGPIAEAKAELIRSQELARQRRLEIGASLESAYDLYQISNQQVEGLESGSLREAEAAVEAARSAYKFGERGILEVLDAQRVLQGVRNDLLEAQFARQSALIDLEELGAISQ
jgi:cobalt-zinc-cadmium efflux system outer membrane protein